MATSKKRQPREDRKVVHTTDVKIDLVVLREIVEELKYNLDKVGGRGDSPVQRSAFHSWNTVNKFLKEHDNGEDFVILNNVSGGVAGASARVYYFPSITSLCKKFRRCIVPINPENKFVYFDLKAAEFALNCMFTGEREALDAYYRGEDIYCHYNYIFPENTDRSVKKQCLIANMYGVSDYRVALNCGISESQARVLLQNVARALPKMTKSKEYVIERAKTTGSYWCPSILSNSMYEVYSWKENGDEFKPLLALSAYVQSALGLWMANFINFLEQNVSGTILSVFDSCLFEVPADKVEVTKEWVKKNVRPFVAGDVKSGNNFYEVCI